MMAALTVLSAVLATGCISEKYDMPDNLQSVTVMLDVSAEDAITKVAGDPEAPTAVESAIKSIRIFAYYGERLAGTFFGGSMESTEHIFIDLALPETGIHEVDFYVIVNENGMTASSGSPTITENMSKKDLSNIIFSGLNTIGTNGMPMYGVTTASINVDNVKKDASGNYISNTAAGHNGHIQLAQTVEIGLYRPLAKLSFMVAKKKEGDITVNDVRILAKGTRQYGYLFPATDDKLQAVGSRANDRVLATNVKINNVLSKEDSKVISEYQDLTSGGIYIAEVPYGSTAWNTPVDDNVNSVVLQLTFTSGEETQPRVRYIYLPTIVRNTHYKVLCSILPEGIITINCIVDDWTDATMWEGGLTFDYPTHSCLWPKKGSEAISENPATMSATTPFVGYFRMTYPENETFKPTLLDGSSDDYEVNVYNESGTLLTNPDDYKASDQWYKIEVEVKNSSLSGNTVKLAITYKPSWSEMAEPLIINTNGTNFIWPFVETEVLKQDTDYVIITQQ